MDMLLRLLSSPTAVMKNLASPASILRSGSSTIQSVFLLVNVMRHR